jgi:hypothetical protein
MTFHPDRAMRGLPRGGTVPAMTASFEELDKLSSRELHDRAVHHAKRHLDVRFFWRLMEFTPAAEIASGDLEEAETEVLHWSSQVDRAVTTGDEQLLDGRRAYYIAYLTGKDT